MTNNELKRHITIGIRTASELAAVTSIKGKMMELKETLKLHEMWLNSIDGGVRANLRGADLSYADLRGADLRGANLSYANLIGANLRGANISDSNLIGSTGNNAEVKTLQLGRYITTITKTTIFIGCKTHTIEEWENFTDDEISKMDDGALEWWTKWKPFIMEVARSFNGLRQI